MIEWQKFLQSVSTSKNSFRLELEELFEPWEIQLAKTVGSSSLSASLAGAVNEDPPFDSNKEIDSFASLGHGARGEFDVLVEDASDGDEAVEDSSAPLKPLQGTTKVDVHPHKLKDLTAETESGFTTVTRNKGKKKNDFSEPLTIPSDFAAAKENIEAFFPPLHTSVAAKHNQTWVVRSITNEDGKLKLYFGEDLHSKSRKKRKPERTDD